MRQHVCASLREYIRENVRSDTNIQGQQYILNSGDRVTVIYKVIIV